MTPAAGKYPWTKSSAPCPDCSGRLDDHQPHCVREQGKSLAVHIDGSAELAGVSIPGLPEGVVAVSWKMPDSGNFTIGAAGVLIKLEPRDAVWPTLIVKPAPGWEFAYSITQNCYRPVRLFASPKKITAHFEVRDAEEEAAVRTVKSSPGFQRFEE